MGARFALVVFFVFGLIAVGCGSSDDSSGPDDASSDVPVDASSDGNSLPRDAGGAFDATFDSGRDDATIADGAPLDDASLDGARDASDLDASASGDAADAADADPCSGFVADTSCFLPGACAAGNVASSCHNGVIVPCVTGSPSGVSETICNGADDNCNSSTDELAPTSASACPKVVNIVIVYDGEAAALVPDLPDVISAGYDSAAARFTAASNASTHFSPRVALNLGAQINWSLLVPSDFTPSVGDPVDPLTLLASFNTWVNAHRAAIDTMAGSPADFLILMTGHTFTSGVALPWLDGMCTNNDNAIISVPSAVDLLPSEQIDKIGDLIAHEIGRNMNLPNDSGSGFIMSAAGYFANAPFSAASITGMNNFFASEYSSRPQCLDDAPTVAWSSEHCGDGRKGPHESCDPGVDIADACCTSTCTLGVSCACANTEACCNAGVVVSAGKTCRAASSTCDLADICDGVASDCPFDKIQAPGTACTSSGGFAANCYAGRCISGQQELNAISGVTTDTFCYSPVSAPDLCTQINFNTTGSTTVCDTAYLDISIDGLICGAGDQCLGGTCQASSALTTYSWTTSPWSVCSSGYQTRTVACVDETGASASASSCPTQPVTLRGCP